MPDPSQCDPATVRAIGKLVAFLATLLHRNGALDANDFADKLAVFATITGEADPPAGLRMAYWAGLAQEVAGEAVAGGSGGAE